MKNDYIENTVNSLVEESKRKMVEEKSIIEEIMDFEDFEDDDFDL